MPKSGRGCLTKLVRGKAFPSLTAAIANWILIVKAHLRPPIFYCSPPKPAIWIKSKVQLGLALERLKLVKKRQLERII